MTALLKRLILSGAILTLIYFGLHECSYSFQDSDEIAFRREFEIPDAAQLTEYQTSPEGWGPRESLNTQAVFSFPSEAAFETYRQNIATNTEQWRSLPVSDKLIAKMSGITYAIQQRAVYKQLPEKSFPNVEKQNFPTIEEQVKEWKRKKGIPEEGYYRCLTAGNNIMGDRKVRCLEDDKTQNDAMFAILDIESQTLSVTVWTSY